MSMLSNRAPIVVATVLVVCSNGFEIQATDPVLVTSPLDSVGTYTRPLDQVGVTGLPPAVGYSVGSYARYTKGLTGTNAIRYSTGVSPNHPYDSADIPGNVGQHSSRYFAPGYGYQPPFVGIQLNAFRGYSSQGNEYQFGNGASRPRDMTSHSGNRNAYGRPRQLPGATTNFTPRKSAW